MRRTCSPEVEQAKERHHQLAAGSLKHLPAAFRLQQVNLSQHVCMQDAAAASLCGCLPSPNPQVSGCPGVTGCSAYLQSPSATVIDMSLSLVGRRVDTQEARAERAQLRQQLDRAYDVLKFKRTEERNLTQDVAMVSSCELKANSAGIDEASECWLLMGLERLVKTSWQASSTGRVMRGGQGKLTCCVPWIARTWLSSWVALT